jgi:hypothetical protein
MYSTIPIHWNIKSAPASPGRSHVGAAFYVFSFLAKYYPKLGAANRSPPVISISRQAQKNVAGVTLEYF